MQSKTIIVESYLVGSELMAIYTIINGEISLSLLNEKHISEDHDRISGLCDILIFPSKYQGKYLTEMDPGIRAFLKGISALVFVTLFLLSGLTLSLFMSNSSLVSMPAAIGIPMAIEVGYNPMPVSMVCVFCASLAMATPAATTTITMVQVAGYRFKDYLRIGGLTGIIGLITAWVAIVLIYGLISF